MNNDQTVSLKSHRSLQSYTKQFVACLVLQLAATFPVFIFVPPYIDDLGRSGQGYLNWSNDGRPLADLLTAALNNGTHLALTSPLLQLLSLLFTAAAGTLLARCFDVQKPWLGAACSLPIAAQPYFLENLSYRFDSVSMAAGLLLAVLCGLVIKENPKVNSLALSIPLAIGSLAFYQPVFYSIAVVAILGGVFMDCRAARTGPRYNLLCPIALALSTCVASLIVYKYLLVGILFQGRNVAYRSQDIGFGKHLPFALRNRIVEYWSLLSADWGTTLIGLLALLILLSYVVSVLWTPRFWIPQKLGHAAFRVLAALAVISTAHGPSLLLTRPLMELPRTMATLGVVFSCLLMHLLQTVTSGNNQSRLGFALRGWVYSLTSVFAYALIVNAYSYAAAFRAQNDYEMSVLTRLAYDIDKTADRVAHKNGVRVGFIGSLPASVTLKNSVKSYPYLKRIIPVLINGNWIWGGVKLAHVTGYAIDQVRLDNPEALSSRITAMGVKPLFRSPLYQGYKIDDTLVIRFNSFP